ncbi:MAG: rhodanese-like domain-containing protein [Desulfuromonadales bacterium]
MSGTVTFIDAPTLKAAIAGHDEIALIDPREEGLFGEAHLLLAINIPFSRLELRIGLLVPRKGTRIVLVDDGGGLSERAARKLVDLGYSSVEILAEGNKAWQVSGFELFSGMSVPTKAFGEWIAVTCRTPLISAEELHKKLSGREDVIVLDSRPANEYVNMTIPGSINVPVSELVYRFGELSVSPDTLVVVNCAGRTRSLIGAQTLIDAGIPNRVVALKGGTMAWQMAGFKLEHDATRHAPEPWGKNLHEALSRARVVAERNRVQIIDQVQLAAFKAEQEQRTLYIIDIRTPDEFLAGHRRDSFHAWGVQLVQSTDRFVATRNARLVLIDNYQVRALLTASWLVQIGWVDTFVLSDPFRGVELESGSSSDPVPESAENRLPRISPLELHSLLAHNRATVIDFSDSLSFKRGHIPGAWFAIRSRLAENIDRITADEQFVATGNDHALTLLAATDLRRLSGRPVAILEGGNHAWIEAGYELATGLENLATEVNDIFRMPFLWGHFKDKTEFEKAANDYFEWELQLPEQLRRAGEIEFARRA